MKKILFSLFLFLIIFTFQKPETISANCYVLRHGTSCPQIGSVDCVVNGLTSCCPNQIECQNLKLISDPTCMNGDGINTAIGCIPVNNVNNFTGWILGWAIGIGGGIAFLLIVYASFMTITSQGNPERLKAGQELLTSAISGLILLIFSVFILKFIGVDILGLGIFGFGN